MNTQILVEIRANSPIPTDLPRLMEVSGLTHGNPGDNRKANNDIRELIARGLIYFRDDGSGGHGWVAVQ